MEAFADRVEAEIEGRAPGFRVLVTGRHVLSPPALEAGNANLAGGALGGGTTALGNRRCSGRSRVSVGPRPPCAACSSLSASAHPGGGVHGVCGSNVARVALPPTGSGRSPAASLAEAPQGSDSFQS